MSHPSARGFVLGAATAAVAVTTLSLVAIACAPSDEARPSSSNSNDASLTSEAIPTQPVGWDESMPLPVRPASAEQAFVLTAPKDGPRMHQWFGGVPANIRSSSVDPGGQSNIRRDDYAGAESCKECHGRNYRQWSEHAHRWMNAWASDETVKGDFSGEQTIEYMGGVGSFFQEGDDYRMRLERDGVRREFTIRRTIGSRFFQYYVGRMLEGPEEASHKLRHIDHVLPFGYWFEADEWVPIVNVGDGEVPDPQRDDPFENPSKHHYDAECSVCHTTRPTGDSMLWLDFGARMDEYSPRGIHFSTEEYLRDEHPRIAATLGDAEILSYDEISETLVEAQYTLDADEHTVNLGISCEACHNGCAEHAEKGEEHLPSFFPRSELVFLKGVNEETVWGHNDTNANFICSRCHAGSRNLYAAGISTWNSTEFTDATRGSCYDRVKARRFGMDFLTCVHCHNPHQGIGQKWTKTPEQDDATCLSCHDQFNEESELTAHTHHPVESAGSRCMNCHMPKINEGMQDLVRTHTIFSPTEKRMIEANHPNACNICHVDKPIDWTLTHLEEWYGATQYSESEIVKSYPEREQPAAVGWLESPHHGTRLVGSDALTRARATWALGDLIDMLNDPYLINRQFTGKGIETMLGVNLRDLGYRFYMFEEERAAPIAAVRESLIRAD